MYYINLYSQDHVIPHGLMARILGFHPRGPGSIPGVGDLNFFHLNMYLIFKSTEKQFIIKLS